MILASLSVCALILIGASPVTHSKPGPAADVVAAAKSLSPIPARSTAPIAGGSADKAGPGAATALAPLVDQAINNATGDQVQSRVARTEAGFLVAYETHQYGADWDILVSRLGPAGAPWALTNLTWDNSQAQSAADIASNLVDDQALVVFEHEYSGADHDIYALRIAAVGGGTMEPGWIPVTASSAYELAPAVAYNPIAGEYLVVWMVRIGDPEFPTYDVHARRVSAAGVLLGSEIYLATGSEDDRNPGVAYDPVGRRYLVTWSRYVGGDYDIYGLLLDDAGSVVGTPIAIAAWTSDQRLSSVAANSRSGGFLVACEHFRTADTWDIWGVRVSSTGSVLGTIQVGGGSGNSRNRPAITYSAGPDEYAVVYEYAYAPTDRDLLARRLDPASFPLTDEFWITNSASETLRPAITGNVGDGFEVVWQDARDFPTSAWDVYGSYTSITVSVPPVAAVGPLRLSPPRPHPVHGAAELTLSGGEGAGRVQVVDVAGRVVRAWETGAAPEVVVRWDGRRADGGRAAPGLYLVRAVRGNAQVTRRLILVE